MTCAFIEEVPAVEEASLSTAKELPADSSEILPAVIEMHEVEAGLLIPMSVDHGFWGGSMFIGL
jgi:hypothetical protein